MSKSEYIQEIKRRMGEKFRMRYGTRVFVLLAIGVYVLANATYFMVELLAFGLDLAVVNLVDNLLPTLFVEAFLIFGLYIIFRFYLIPEEIYNEQSETIRHYKKERLWFDVVDSPIETKSTDDGEQIPTAIFRGINLEKQEIQALQGWIHTVIQYQVDRKNNKVKIRRHSIGQQIDWGDGKTEITLRPQTAQDFEIAELKKPYDKKSKPRIHFGVGRLNSPDIKKESIYVVRMGFSGKLEGNPNYKFTGPTQVLYCYPKKGILTTWSRAQVYHHEIIFPMLLLADMIEAIHASAVNSS
jgi:hypothetical protein